VKIRQILINLITNAFKFTNEGKIEVSATIEDKKIIFSVKDTGIGIPEEKFDTVFNRFTQIEMGRSRGTKGTGLGLPIVKGLVEMLGGKVWLESVVDKGAAFYFTIPYSTATPNYASKTNFDDETTLISSGKAILVVEDDPDNVAYIQEILSSSAHQLIFVETGKEAVNVAAKNSIDLVLMDIRLPDMSGYEAIRLIQSEKPDMKIIVQTAYAAGDDRMKAKEMGCVGYISKPLQRQQLLSLIKKNLL
jgi:CheY-like chemotaxis protein